MSLTLSVCSTADDIGEFGFEACVGGAVLARSFVAARTEWDHTLQRCVGPQTLTLMDSQRCGVVNQQTSILCTKQKKCHVIQAIYRLSVLFSAKNTVSETN